MSSSRALRRLRAIGAVAIGIMVVFPVASFSAIAQDLYHDDDGVITQISQQDRDAFVEQWMDVFGRKTRDVETMPDHYNYSEDVQKSLLEDLIGSLKTYNASTAAQFDPAIVGPQLGWSSPSDPLVDKRGEPITQERVDAAIGGILGGLVFDRTAFRARMQDSLDRQMQNARNDAVEGPAPSGPSTGDQMREKINNEPISHWANDIEDAAPPADFVVDAPDAFHMTGAVPQDFQVNIPQPARPDLIAPNATVQVGIPQVPPVGAVKPSFTEGITKGIARSPLNTVDFGHWLDPALGLDIPGLLRFLSGFLNLPESDVLHLLGILGSQATHVFAEVRGTLQEFPALAQPVGEMRAAAALLDRAFTPLAAPLPLTIRTPGYAADLPPAVQSLVEQAGGLAQRASYSADVNGQQVSGAWGQPQRLDLDGDNITDVVLTFAPPRLTVDRVNPLAGLVAPAAGQLPPGTIPPTPASQPLPLVLALVYYLPGSDVLVAFNAVLPTGWAHYEQTLTSLTNPAMEVKQVGAVGAFSVATMFLDNRGNPIVAVQGAATPLEFTASAALNATTGESRIQALAVPPGPLQVVGVAQGATSRLAVGITSDLFPKVDVAGNLSGFHVDTLKGSSLAIDRQVQGLTRTYAPGNGGLPAGGTTHPIILDPLRTLLGDLLGQPKRTFTTQALSISEAPQVSDVTLRAQRVTVDADSAGATYIAIVGDVVESSYARATWLELTKAGQHTALDATLSALNFNSDQPLDAVRGVVATSDAAALTGAVPVGVFRMRDDLVAFSVGRARSVKVTHGGPGTFTIDIATTQPLSAQGVRLPGPGFLVDAVQGADQAQFLISNLPSRITISTDPKRVTLQPAEPVDQVVGVLDRASDTPSVLASSPLPPLESILNFTALTSNVNLVFDGGQANVFSPGTLGGAEFMASNVLNGTNPDHLFSRLPGYHVLSNSTDGVVATSLSLPGVLGNLTGLVLGPQGNLTLNLAGIGGALCQKLSRNGYGFEICFSNVPDSIRLGFKMSPPTLTYDASDWIHNLSLRMFAPTLDMGFYILEIPGHVAMALADSGMTFTMSARLRAIAFYAHVGNVTMAGAVEDIPMVMSFTWGVTGLNPRLEEGDAIGRVYLLLQSPQITFNIDLRHIPLGPIEWDALSLRFAPVRDRIGELLILLAVNSTIQFRLQVEGQGIPGFNANWNPLGATIETTGPLDSLGAYLAVGDPLDPTIGMAANLSGVPVMRFNFNPDNLNFSLDGRIAAFAFALSFKNATNPDSNLLLALGATGIPGMSAKWDPLGGSFATTAPLDTFNIQLVKGNLLNPFLLLELSLVGVPKVDAAWDAGSLGFDFNSDRITSLSLRFIIQDPIDNSHNIYLSAGASGIPGLKAGWQAGGGFVETLAPLDEIHLILVRGPLPLGSLAIFFQITGVPQARFDFGLPGFSLGLAGRITSITLDFIAGDLSLYLDARGVPGFAMQTANKSLATTGVLDSMTLQLIKGTNLTVYFGITGVPQVTFTWGLGGFNADLAGHITSITFRFTLDDLFISLEALHIPGAILNTTARTLGTSSDLGSITLLLTKSTNLSLYFSIRGVPQLSLGWNLDGIHLSLLDGRISSITFQFILDDLRLYLDARGVPGLNFDTAQKILTTTGRIDSIVALLTKTSLQLSVYLGIFGVPQLGVRWSNLDKNVDIQPIIVGDTIDQITFQFILGNLRIYLNALQVPGVTFDVQNHTLQTTAALGSITALLTLDETLPPLHLSVFAQIVGVPRLVLSWDDVGTDANLALTGVNGIGSPKITSLTFQVVLNDLMIYLGAEGIPTLTIHRVQDDVQFTALDGLDAIRAIIKKGPYYYSPFTRPMDFLAVYLRPLPPTGASPAEILTYPQFAVSAKLTGFKGVTYHKVAVGPGNTAPASNVTTLGLGFTTQKSFEVLVDLVLPDILTAFLDAKLLNLPAELQLQIDPNADQLLIQPSALAPGDPLPSLTGAQLQAQLYIGTPKAYAETPAPRWPWQTSVPPALTGIMANTLVDFTGLLPGHAPPPPQLPIQIATKWHIFVNLPTIIHFSKHDDNGLPNYDMDTGGVDLGKLDLRADLRLDTGPIYGVLDVGVVTTVSNLPDFHFQESLHDGNPFLSWTAGTPIDNIFIGLHFDNNWYKTADRSGVFPIFVSVSDVPSDFGINLGKASWTNPEQAPFFNFHSNADTLDAVLRIDITKLWSKLGKPLVAYLAANVPDKVPDWLVSMSSFDIRGHLEIGLENVPHDGITIATELHTCQGNLCFLEGPIDIIIDPGSGGKRGNELGLFYVDFNFLLEKHFSDDGCIVCLGVVDLKYDYNFGLRFGIYKFNLVMEHLKFLRVTPGVKLVIDLDGRFAFGFRAGVGFTFQVGISLYIIGIFIFRIPLGIPWIDFVIDPGFLSVSTRTDSFGINYWTWMWPCHWGEYWCHTHEYAGVHITWPNQWQFDLPVEVTFLDQHLPSFLNPDGINVRGACDPNPAGPCSNPWHIYMDPRVMTCVSVDDDGIPIVCVEVFRLIDPWIIVLVAFIDLFHIEFDFWSEHHHH